MDVKTNDGVATVVIGDTMVELWKLPATLARWRFIQTQRGELIEKHGTMVAFSLILSSSSPPDGALRASMQDDFRRMGPKLRRMVVVPLGNSVWQSLVRTIVRGVLLLSGLSKQQVVASTIDDGIARVREISSPSTPDGMKLREATRLLAEALDAGELEQS